MEVGVFSIREYVSRMRSVNVVKCWPFDEITSEETVKSLLPPITVKKFTYWLDGLEYLQSKLDRNVENSKKKKKKVQEKEEISLRSEDDVDESDFDVDEGIERVKVKSLKGKAKTLKKRSIVEIFAVAPQVERVSGEDYEDEEEGSVQENYGFYDSKFSCHEEINCGLKGKKKKQKKNKEIILSKLKKPKKVINKLKKKKKEVDEMDLPVADKENHFTLKLQTRDNAIENPNSSNSQETENNKCDRVSTHKRKPRLQCKKNTICESSKLTAKNTNPKLPISGILKNRTKLVSLQQSTNHILQEAIQVTNCGKQNANKHVTFLEKDGILRRINKPFLSAECLNLQKYCGSDMDTVAALGVGKDSIVGETSGREAFFNRMENEVDAELESEELLTLSCCTVDTTNFLMQCNTEGLFVKSVTDQTEMHGMNQHLFKSGLSEAQQYAYTPRFFYVPLEGYCSKPNIKVVGNSSSSTYGRVIEDFGMPDPRIPLWCFKDHLKEYKEPSANKAFSLSTVENYNAHPFEYRTFPHHSPKELLLNLYSPSDGNQSRIICGKRSINEDFVGLPLNSRGEFIKLNSCAKRDFNQMMQSGIAADPSISLSQPGNAVSNCLDNQSVSWDCGMSPRNQLNLFPVEGYVKEKPAVFISSGSDDIECQNKWRTNLDLEFIKINNHSFQSDKSVCEEDNQVQKCHGNEKIQPTMRLMGKDFIVGGRGFQGFEDENHWKDKEILDELHFANTSIKNVMMHHQNEPSSVNPRENCLTHQNCFAARKINPAQICISQGTFPAVQNSESVYPEPFTSGYEAQVFNLELPTPTLACEDSCSNAILSAIQPKNKQNVPCIPSSAIRFPFMHPDVEGHVPSSWSWNSSVNPSPLFFDVLEKGTTLSYRQAHCNLGRNHHPRAMLDLQSSMALDYSTPAPPIQNIHIPCYPRLIPISSMQKRHGSQRKIKEQIESRIGIRGIDQIKKAQRKHSAISDDYSKLSKMPSLGFEEEYQHADTKSTTHVDFEGNLQNNENAFEQRIYPWMDSYSGTMSGPVKLTAGAKHILQACQQIDQSSSMSTHSNIPFAATTSGFKFLGSGTSTNLYTF